MIHIKYLLTFFPRVNTALAQPYIGLVYFLDRTIRTQKTKHLLPLFHRIYGERKNDLRRTTERSTYTAAAILSPSEKQDRRNDTLSTACKPDRPPNLEATNTGFLIFPMAFSSVAVAVPFVLESFMPFVFHPMLIIKEIGTVRVQLNGNIISAIDHQS